MDQIAATYRKAAIRAFINLSEVDKFVAVKPTGFANNYYKCRVNHPRDPEQPAYSAECEDVIGNLRMTFDEGCEFKAIWRTAAARNGTTKPGHNAVYDAEKRVHYATRSLAVEKQNVS